MLNGRCSDFYKRAELPEALPSLALWKNGSGVASGEMREFLSHSQVAITSAYLPQGPNVLLPTKSLDLVIEISSKIGLYHWEVPHQVTHYHYLSS